MTTGNLTIDDFDNQQDYIEYMTKEAEEVKRKLDEAEAKYQHEVQTAASHTGDTFNTADGVTAAQAAPRGTGVEAFVQKNIYNHRTYDIDKMEFKVTVTKQDITDGKVDQANIVNELVSKLSRTLIDGGYGELGMNEDDTTSEITHTFYFLNKRDEDGDNGCIERTEEQTGED